MGRRNLIGAVASACALAAAVPAAEAGGLHWTVVASGRTVPSGRQAPVGYVAVTRAEEQRWLPRLSRDDRLVVERLNLRSTGAVAAFLDGLPCGSHLTVSGVARSGPTLAVELAYTRPPPGVATCVRASTPYLVLGIPRTSLGRAVPTSVVVSARARA